MVETGTGERNIYKLVEQVQFEYIHHQAHVYFGIKVIGNVWNHFLPNPLVVSSLQKLSKNSQKVQIFYDRVRSYIIDKAIEGSITNTYINKIRLHIGGYPWHRWELPVLPYHEIMAIYPYPFFCGNYHIVLLNNMHSWLYMYINWFTWIIFIIYFICYKRNWG